LFVLLFASVAASAQTVPQPQRPFGQLVELWGRQLDRIAARINTIPRRSLGWGTAADRYHHAVAMTG